MILLLAASAFASDAKITVDPSRPTVAVNKSLFGIFFEEINQAGEGGLYGEMLRNRGFDSLDASGIPVGWHVIGSGLSMTADNTNLLNPMRSHSLKITSDGTKSSVVNDGFWGLHVERGRHYKFVVWWKAEGSGYNRIALVSGGKEIAERSERPGSEWTRSEVDLLATESSDKAQLWLTPSVKTTWIGYASLMPAESWHNHPFRTDLADKLERIKPGFIRFPGGCFVEGETLPIRWNWKDSLGPIERRRGMPHSQWGYPISNGLGFHEYLQLCEDLHAEPLFVVNVGMSHREVQPMAKMDSYLQDTLDAIEYANGSISSKWGGLRARNGHPKPFNLKYIEIGNENGGPPYNERFQLYSDAIHAKYPEIQRIADVWGGLPTSAGYELIDEHYYNSPAWFWRNADHYDTYSRNGPKIYVGEYAVTQGCGRGNLAAALGEAAFMTGLERNADVVQHASYAPLFENVNNRQWNPNAILFDSSRSYGTPSYWVQSLFAQNRVDQVVNYSITMPPAKQEPIGGRVGLQTWRTSAEFKNIEVSVDGKRVNPATPNLEKSQGNWGIDDGVIKQTSLEENRRALVAGVDASGAKKVEMHLLARKDSGDEGFIIMFEVRPGREIQWNLGGWGNTVHAFQLDGARFGKGVPGSIETGRWYDIRIEEEPGIVRGYLDGKLVEVAKLANAPDFAAVAGIDKGRNELVLTVVNGSAETRSVDLEIQGIVRSKRAEVITLASNSLDDENSFEQPMKIAPRKSTATVSPHGAYSFGPYSLTILRIPR